MIIKYRGWMQISNAEGPAFTLGGGNLPHVNLGGVGDRQAPQNPNNEQTELFGRLVRLVMLT